MLSKNEGGNGGEGYLNLKIVVGEEGKDIFFVTDSGDTYSSVKGTLDKLESSFTAKSETVRGDVYGAKIYLTDGEEKYRVDTTITNASKDLINSILSLKEGDEVELVVYTNKKGYPSSGAIINKNAESVKDRFAPNFLEWSDAYKENFKPLLHAELEKRAPAKEVEAEAASVEDLPF